MGNDMPTLKPIARIKNDFNEKFGVPRQSGLAPSVISKIIFEKDFSDKNMIRGIGQFSHLWLIWGFSECGESDWSATVRPPRLGGNKRMGVFATRSPFRPNHLALSAVKLEGTEETDGKTALLISGADILNGSPVYDIKPYIPYSDSIPDAAGGFAEENKGHRLTVIFSENTLETVAPEKRAAVREILSLDPRPAYNDDPQRVYGTSFGEYNIKFKVSNGILTVTEVLK